MAVAAEYGGRDTFKGRRPLDGQSWKGCLIGGYKDTQEEISKALKNFYGIRCDAKVTGGVRLTSDIKIPPDTDIVVIIADRLVSGLRVKIYDVARKLGVPWVEVDHTFGSWKTPMEEMGFSTPPKWRDGIDVDKYQRTIEVEDRSNEPKPAPPPRPHEVKIGTPVLSADKLGKLSLVGPPAKGGNKTPPPPPKVSAATKDKFADFGPRLTAAREKAGLSKAELAAKMDMSPSGIANWEAGKGGPPTHTKYAKLREVMPGVFPYVPGLKGEKTANAKLGKPLAAPKTPYVPATGPLAKKPEQVVAKASEPVPAPAVEPVPLFAPKPEAPRPSAAMAFGGRSSGVMVELAAAVAKLELADQELELAVKKREDALAEFDAVSRKLTGR